MSRFTGRAHARGFTGVGLLTLATGCAVAFLAACAGDVGESADSPASTEVAAEAFTSEFGPMSDATREEALERLEIQVDYLVQEMDELEASARNGDFPRHASARYELLNDMYVQRLHQYEALRMEAEVNRRLGVS